MKFFQEITQWQSDVPNHVYLLNDSKSRMSGYVPVRTDTLTMFSQPMPFSTRGRRFREVPDRWGYVTESSEPTWQFTGSRGEQHVVTLADQHLTCSCPGYQFRGQCKHVTSVTEQQSQEAA